jgi:membrane-bound lytic murein transglycosylase D
LQLNSLKPDANIEPGQRLRLAFDRIPPSHFENKRLDFLQETEDDFFSAYSVIGQTTYRVNSGDTLWDLCYNKFDIPIWLLERYNSTLNLASLSPAQELIIPIIQAI